MATTNYDVEKLILNPDNPRLINDGKFRQLVKSIQSFPEMLNLRPIVVNNDLVVLGGNMRLRACIEAGLKSVPVIVADDLTEEQQREFIIKDNIGFGEWDWEIIQDAWPEAVEWGLDVPEVKDEHIASENRTLPDMLKVNIMVSVAIEHKDAALKDINEVAARYNGEVLFNDSSTF